MTNDNPSALTNNPFSIHRAEHLGKDLHKFFAMQSLFSGKLGRQSLVLEGGRGCGKTMFFIYHTYESKKQQHKDPSTSNSLVLEKESILGVYFHAKSDVVTGFTHRDIPEIDWIRLFGHYLNLVVAQQISAIAEDIQSSHGIPDPSLEEAVCDECSCLLGFSPAPTSFQALTNQLRHSELELLRYISNPTRFPKPIVTLPGTLPKALADGIARHPKLISKVFHVFVDEFENLLEYQQRVVNTLIKTPSEHFVVDIGLRKEGWKTRHTLATGESISSPHDFKVFEFEVDLTPERYEELLIETCRKRLENFGVSGEHKNFDALSIKSYLGEYALQQEVTLILRNKDRTSLPYRDKLKKLLKKLVKDEKETRRIYSVLAEGPNEIINRLNYCLLLQGKRPDNLVKELEKHVAGQPSSYKEWLHNYELGVAFLLCRDAGVHKRYWGFTTFSLLSSGTIRYFLELCENAFTIAIRKGFNFTQPRPLTVDEQDAAAQAVSLRKVEEVDSYTPHGVNLKHMVGVLGAVFENLHEDPKVSEPERNHFNTRSEELSDTARSVLQSAVLWNVLQERPATKDKAPSSMGSDREFHLNHIYSPFFQISHRRKRSLYIRPEILEKILTSNLQSAKSAGRMLLSKRGLPITDKLESDGDFPLMQTELWIRGFER